MIADLLLQTPRNPFVITLVWYPKGSNYIKFSCVHNIILHKSVISVFEQVSIMDILMFTKFNDGQYEVDQVSISNPFLECWCFQRSASLQMEVLQEPFASQSTTVALQLCSVSTYMPAYVNDKCFFTFTLNVQ